MVIKRRNLYFLFITIILSFCLLELSSFIGIKILKTFRHVQYSPISKHSIDSMKVKVIRRMLDGKNSYFQHSPQLGWTIIPNGISGIYKANSIGIRSNREYSVTPQNNIIRIASFGDSFTHCDQVENSDTWQFKIENVNRKYEVMNFGVSGYGPDQAYLRYKIEGVKYQPDIVLIGLMSENIHRIVNVFRPFYGEKTNFPLSKPRYIIQNDKLEVIPNPLPSLNHYQEFLDYPDDILPVLGENDYHYKTKYGRGSLDFFSIIKSYKMVRYSLIQDRPINAFTGIYNQDSQAFQLLCMIIQSFYQEIIQNGSIPIIVLFPHSYDIKLKKSGNDLRYKPFLEFLDGEGMTYIDLFPVIKTGDSRLDIRRLFNGHYTPYTNQIVSEGIIEYIEKNLEEDLKNSSSFHLGN